jgi:hypothetical protein
MAPTHLKSILLVGVTGPFSFGQFVVESLSRQLQHFDGVAVYHDTSRPTDIRKQKLLDKYSAFVVKIVSAHGYTSPEPFKGFDCVLSFLGNHALNLQPRIIDLAISAGVRHFYPSEYGADLMVGSNRTQRYYVHKIATREHLERRGREIPELGWMYFLLGRLTEWAVISHFGIENKEAKARIYGSAEGRQSLISAKDAAEYIVATVKAPLEYSQPDGFRRTFRISESSPTYSEIFDILKNITGGAYEVKYLPVEDAVQEEMDAKARGDIEAELSASHKLIQGRQGTLLPEPWDNAKFPEVTSVTSVEEALRDAFATPYYRRAYGLM